MDTFYSIITLLITIGIIQIGIFYWIFRNIDK